MDLRVRALYKIEPQPEGPAQARRIIAEELATRVPETVIDDVMLMVSELVTNGIVHGSTEADEPVMLDLLVNGHIRCRVLDHGDSFAAPHARDEEVGGWGLQVVEQLADRWGVQRSPQRTEVWFERGCS
ncbi:MAG: ATP-binding protein [Solirubrobacterales bacterium]|nr:ATP-binding protein [Solirubrobacterales bacterium]